MENPEDSGRWIFHRRLGAGAFGVVELWRNDYTAAMIAIKKCKGGSNVLSAKQRDRWIKEVHTMNSLKHANIVATLRVPSQLQKLDGAVPVLCMEYCSRGDLRTILNEAANCCGIDGEEASKIMLHVSSAVEYLHSRKLTHRDLKPENVVLQSTRETTVYKLTDLGYVRELGEKSVDASVVGTMNYLAPELLMEPTYTCSVDYWSLGILFYELVTGTRPFLPNMPITITWMNHIKRKRAEDICAWEEGGNVTFSTEIESPSTVSDCLRRFLTDWFRIALQWDPKKRGKLINREGQQELVVFSMLRDILSWKLLRIFVVSQYKVESFAVHPFINVGFLHNMIQERTGIDFTQQILTDRKGTVLNNADSIVQNCTKDSFLIVYQKEKLLVEKSPVPNISEILRRMMDNPRQTPDNDTLKRYYAAALFFINQELDLFKLYVIALSIKIDLSNTIRDSVRHVVQTLKMRTDDLMTDITAYERSNKFGLMSDELRESFVNTSTKMQSLVRGTQEVSSQLDALSKDFGELNRFSEINWLKQWMILYEEAKVMFEKSLRVTRGHRGSPKAMVKLMYAAFKLRGEQLGNQEILSVVSQIANYDKNILQIQKSLNSFEALINHHRNNYDEIMSKQAMEEQTTCYALINSMTPYDTVIYDHIVLSKVIEEVHETEMRNISLLIDDLREDMEEQLNMDIEESIAEGDERLEQQKSQKQPLNLETQNC